MKNYNVIIISVLVIVAIAIITNPSPDDHRKQVQIELFTPVNNIVGDDMTLQILDIFTRNVTSTTFYLFSQTIYIDGDTRKVIGIGAFGKVYLYEDFLSIINS